MLACNRKIKLVEKIIQKEEKKDQKLQLNGIIPASQKVD